MNEPKNKLEKDVINAEPAPTAEAEAEREKGQDTDDRPVSINDIKWTTKKIKRKA